MKDETKEIKEGFEFIIRNQEGKEIFRETNSENYAIKIVKE